jgi:hypothetical protein
MYSSSFWDLHQLLKTKIINSTKEGSIKRHKNGAWNGLISTSIWLSAALRDFAGGRPDDIALVHGISHSEVYNSVWRAVDAINDCNKLSISYPEDEDLQQAIAKEFEARSRASVSICSGAINGMLIWLKQLSLADCKRAGVGWKKSFCGRKKIWCQLTEKL